MSKTENKKGTDLSSVGKVEDVARIYLFHPSTDEQLLDDDGEKMWVDVYGQDSEVYKTIDRAIADRNIHRASRSGRGPRAVLTAEQADAQQKERIVKCIKGWNILVDGQKPEVNEANIKAVIETYPWVREQIEDGIYDRQLFLKNSSAT